MSNLAPIRRVVGRPIPLVGDNIDTDRIIPARFMKAVTFDGLGRHAFHDERFDPDGEPTGHVMDQPRHQAKGPRIAIVNKNFGCGSSREHAPQALLRWGVKAVVGESFADIFFGNCITLGIPCLTASEQTVSALLAAVEEDPAHDFTLDVEALTATFRGQSFPVQLHESTRNQLLDGTWDALRLLLASAEAVRVTAYQLPYVRGFTA